MHMETLTVPLLLIVDKLIANAEMMLHLIGHLVK
jgi:hypothetical protein